VDVYHQLLKQHEPTAAAYREILTTLDLSGTQQTAFDTVVEQLTHSGWHGFEVTRAWLSLAPKIVVNGDPNDWLIKADTALGFAKLSVEPAVAYWRLVGESLEHGAGPSRLSVLEDLGRQIQSHYQFSAQILTQALRAGADRLKHASPLRFDGWVTVATFLIHQDRELLVAFLAESEPLIDEVRLAELQQVNSRALLEVLIRRQSLVDALPGKHFDAWWQVLMKLAEQATDLSEFLDQLCLCAERISQGDVLRQLVNQINDCQLATAFLEVCRQLPLDRPALCMEWIDLGLAAHEVSPRKGLAFFQLASATATDHLETLRGQVRFDEQKRLLQLFAEAISGCPQQLICSETAEHPEGRSSTNEAASDPSVIFLPESFAEFDQVADNIEFYFVAISHQLGYQQFGTLQQLPGLLRYFRTQPLPRFSGRLFALLEAARIDWQWAHKFAGASGQLRRQKQHALLDFQTALASYYGDLGSDQASGLQVEGSQGLQPKSGESQRGSSLGSRREAQNKLAEDHPRKLLEVLVELTLDIPVHRLAHRDLGGAARLDALLNPLREQTATLKTTLEAVSLIGGMLKGVSLIDLIALPGIAYRRYLPLAAALEKLPALEMAAEDVTTDSDDVEGIAMTVNPKDLMLDDMSFGEVDSDQAMLMTELAEVPEIEGEPELQLSSRSKPGVAEGAPATKQKPASFYYDEWDYHINDYRRRWCRLVEIHDSDENVDYYRQSVMDHLGLQKQVRRQLSRLKPELLVKVRGSPDGCDMDLERAIEAVIDRKAGRSPSERIYVERHRQGRDVAALFLIDLSASTDDRMPDPNAEPPPTEEYHDFDWPDEPPPPLPEGEKIIDLEKHAVIQMTQALEALGDHYAVSGFSGYGRDQVEYTVCKRFNEPLDARVKAKIGGLKACRSTRMGPAIRHAAMQLNQTDARIKALIVISDGYPQDHDYGEDRNDREYGIHDTMKALQEAKQQGVQSFCLTVDPSGHDYLRLMCPDRQYMVIQDVTQLPSELSKVYRSLTG